MINNIMKFLIVAILSFALTNCGSGSSSTDTDKNDTTAPPEAQVKEGYVSLLLPPENWSSGVAWVQAVHDKSKDVPSSVEIDWVRFLCRVDGIDVILAGDDGTTRTGIVWAGLYYRDPWFYNDIHDGITINPNDEIFVMSTSDVSDKVWHAGGERAVVPEDAERCFAEARVKINGPVWFQMGIDYWINQWASWAGTNVNNTEGAVSDWYYGTTDWTVVSVAKP